ncbi:UDP-N-acetyl-D-glucosamine dehydrogenase [Alkalispirochaeta sphaeroplastigenens]|uniref:UDP-N-acetyl-D-glucosamine dehydrogenase n=1 Tax=Alkalispirochaeta sphaeroplastigenens TaxID=1187066 RepID=A0A2S4JFS8_9SPIO|nr:nucleotide sugar dehydrogenase [Alkalispirochaeta sphaeroplastigenens]POQ98373.1 UDP-N-acetyl-D-glucosamine dehydrogenase [Alkalispirochaeta sphaeroplastigenens]
MTHTDFITKIENKTVLVGVLGLGYVGLPLAVTFARQGIRVLGFEKNTGKAEQVNAGSNYIADVEDDHLRQVTEAGTLSATTDFSRIAECDAVIICVPTPLDRFRKPDLSWVEDATRETARYMKKGTFVSLESTTFPTTTENVMLPILEEISGTKCGEGFHLAYSPERVDPGNKTWKTENTPKVVGAMTPEGMAIALKLYGTCVHTLYPVSTPRVAEMVKILENTYRLVNISLMNELALLSGKMDINIWEVIEAAKTKPYGFQAFYPGPGIGGHCIPLDPFYLEYIAKQYDFELSMIHTAGHIDLLMPHRMTIKITSALNRHKKSVNGSRILFLGVAYKPDIADERESPALKIIDEVLGKGGRVDYYDPFIPEAKTPQGNTLKGIADLTTVAEYDLVVVSTRHGSVDYAAVAEAAQLIVDLQNVYPESSERVYKL